MTTIVAILVGIQVLCVLLSIPPIQRIVIVALMLITDPYDWNREALHDYYLMAFHPEKWKRLNNDY